MQEISGQATGRYLIIERVGQGGMSAIFKALDTITNSIVALKVLSAAMATDPTFEARFAREIEVLRSLHHKHILPIIDYGKAKGLPYIVMPFYSHGTLKDLIEKQVPLSQGIRIIKQVSEALEYAHAQGIMHRDVKPSNILLDGDGNAVLSDFGIARQNDSSLSLTGSALIGTPSYMSPEQCRGDEITGASDQYSLAVVIYEMVTGKLPYEAETPMALMYKHLNDPIPNPRDINRNVPEEVEEVLQKALNKDPALRYPSVGAFSQAFLVAAAPQLFGLTPLAIRWRKLRIRFKRFRQRLSQFINDLRSSPAFRRWSRLALTMAIFLAIPLAFWAIVAFGLGPTNVTAATGLSGTEIAGTVYAGFEQTLAAGGERLSEEDMATALHATIMSMLADAASTPTPVGWKPSATPSPSPTATGTQEPSSPTPTEIGADHLLTAETLTPTPTATQSPTPTATVPPTPTATKPPVPTATKPPVPTAIKPPAPTKTPTHVEADLPTSTPDPCENLSVSGFDVEREFAAWLLTNDTEETVLITGIHFYWPALPNERLNKVMFSRDVVWDEGDEEPPTYLYFSTKEELRLAIGAGQSTPLGFQFGATAAEEDYTLKVIFNNGCYLWDYR